MKDSEYKKTDAYWKEHLTSEEYHVLREKGTESAYSSAFWDNKEKGMYVCRACGAELFSSETKFDSGSGWPSFTSSKTREAVSEESDNSLGVTRTEVVCSRCGGHLGHVFPDGPKPTGLRYCINGAALNFKEE